MKRIALSEAKDQLSKYLRDAEREEIVILRHGKPAGVLIGFKSEEDWFDYRVENDPRFLERVEQARRSIQEGKGIRLEDVRPRPPLPNKRMQPARTKHTVASAPRRARG